MPKSTSRRIVALLLGLFFLGHARAQPTQVSFPTLSAEQVTIRATLYRPSGHGPFPGIVLMHHCAGIDGVLTAMAQHFAEEGYVAIVPDSFGSRGFGSVCANGRMQEGQRAPDAYAAADYLRGLPEVRADRIGVIGYSHGAGAVTYVVSHKPLSKPFRAAVAYYPFCLNRPPQVNAPTLVLSGDQDDWTPAAPCVAWGNEVHDPSKLEVVVYPGATHAFDVQRRTRAAEGRGGVMHHLDYNPAAASDAAARMEAFFAKWLKS